MNIETERLLLRKHCIEDFDRYWSMITDPVAKLYTGGVTTLTYDERKKIFEEDCKTAFSDEGMEFAVIEKASQKYVGYCGYRFSEELSGNEIFYGYCRDSWGKGCGFEAAEAAVDYFFSNTGINSLIATYDINNTASIRILTRLGFQIEGKPENAGTNVIEKLILYKEKYTSYENTGGRAMKQYIGACGCICSDCPLFNKECKGCYDILGKPCWLPEVNLDVCDFYECAVINKKLKHCGECEQIPCQKFWTNKNPQWTEEQHKKIVESRTILLKELAGR